MAVGNGELRTPANAVVRNAGAEALYENASFVAGLEALGLSPNFAAVIGLITDVRASDLVARLEHIKGGGQPGTGSLGIHQIYRTLSKLCAGQENFFATVGDLSMTEFHRRFSDGGGLVCIRDMDGNCLLSYFSGRDVFHKSELFVPTGAAYQNIWQALNIGPPGLSACTVECRERVDC